MILLHASTYKLMVLMKDRPSDSCVCAYTCLKYWYVCVRVHKLPPTPSSFWPACNDDDNHKKSIDNDPRHQILPRRDWMDGWMGEWNEREMENNHNSNNAKKCNWVFLFWQRLVMGLESLLPGGGGLIAMETEEYNDIYNVPSSTLQLRGVSYRGLISKIGTLNIG